MFRLIFWGLITPIFPYLRDALLRLRLLWHDGGRQRYCLGWLASGRRVEDFIQFLVSRGFHNHFIAWVDEKEILGVRRLHGPVHQYHLRLFKDGEIRGHYEKTPESHIIDHLWERGMEERREVFLNFLEDWCVQERAESGKTISQSAPATLRGLPEKG